MHTNGKACLFSHFFCLSPSLSGDTLSELAAAITCVLNRLTTYLASVSIGCQSLDYLLAPIMVRTGEKLRLAGRIVEHEPPKVHPWLSGSSWPTRLWPTCPGRLLHCYYHTGPKAEWGELSTCKCAHEQPYCHLIVSERGLGMHLPVTSTSLSAILLAQGEERVEDETGSYLRGLEEACRGTG